MSVHMCLKLKNKEYVNKFDVKNRIRISIRSTSFVCSYLGGDCV